MTKTKYIAEQLWLPGFEPRSEKTDTPCVPSCGGSLQFEAAESTPRRTGYPKPRRVIATVEHVLRMARSHLAEKRDAECRTAEVVATPDARADALHLHRATELRN